jgi:prepilin-type N-terminal cleavage/methylation domain-containing protein
MENKNIEVLKKKNAGAFTLIELLVVIAIIAILAGLIANLAGNASNRRRIKRVEAELAKLETVIDAYQLKLGYYPPDNGNLVTDDATRPSARTNQLFYELAGATYDAGPPARYVSLVRGKDITTNEVDSYFKRVGIVNSQSAKQFYAAKEVELKPIGNTADDVLVLVVPVDLNPGEINPWRYDASSTNRHNQDSYDLWAEISIGGKTMTIGNWKE